MFKLVIVEDEDNIRHSLECYIPWETLGFRVVGTFSDGSDALAYLKENPCDAVLTDILMSRMSGLEMIRNLYALQPQIKVVILSGHSDFAYAQQAIEYKVAHYLVKPVDEDELIAVFKSLADQLAEQQEEQTAAESQTRELKQILQKSFFRDLLSGRVASENEFNVYLKLLGQENLQNTCPLYAYEIQTMGSLPGAESEESSIEDVFRQHLAPDGDTCRAFLLEGRGNHWQIVFVGLPGCDGADLRKYCNEKMQRLVAALNDSAAGEFTFHLTHSVARLADLLTETTDKKTAAEKQQVDSALCETVISDYKLLVVELDLGSKDTLLHLLDGILYRLKDAALEDAQFALKNLYSVIELDYRKRKINVWDITNGKFNFNHLYRAKDMHSLSASLKEDFCALCDGLKIRKPGSEHGVIGRLVQYLNEHLDEDVAHNEIAAKYRIHPGYLSRLFKQEMGETLSEYLLRIRIQRAASLLKEGQHKIGDIAGMVGYSASSYFSIMFKKYTGYSPREYMQRVSL
ncbi:MAG: response regulator [Oscillospiraceae bacterium]|nr:response regulator [Oscillospiraceae bacterium]